VDLPFYIERIDGNASPPTLLEQGDVDAVVIPYTGPMYEQGRNVRPLFEDLESAEHTYYDDTNFYPLMHTVVIRDAVIDAHPWVPTELLKAFRRSVDVFQERTRYEAKYPLVWWQQYREQEREIFGDIWSRSFEFEANADELRTMVRFANEQGLVDEVFDVDQMFVRADENLL
jgi:4,5-dihydroxyphthalate decarboxylase